MQPSLLVILYIIAIFSYKGMSSQLTSESPGMTTGWIDLTHNKRLMIFGIDQTILDRVACTHDYNDDKIKAGIAHKIKVPSLDGDEYYYVQFVPGFIEYLREDRSKDVDYILYTRKSFLYGISIAEYITHLVNALPVVESKVMNPFKFAMVVSTQIPGIPYSLQKEDDMSKGLDIIMDQLKPVGKPEYRQIIILDADMNLWKKNKQVNGKYEAAFLNSHGNLETIKTITFDVLSNPSTMVTYMDEEKVGKLYSERLPLIVKHEIY